MSENTPKWMVYSGLGLKTANRRRNMILVKYNLFNNTLFFPSTNPIQDTIKSKSQYENLFRS